ncbi:MAG TPA: EAL domain-containing protein, partial [Longimicrobiales bacterium]|nr:EAL domain-containing protein [Longimicrobiales bacterium]
EKGTFQVFADSTSAGVFRWMELRADLPAALQRHQLALHYQPVVDMISGEVVGAEALLRWEHPHLGRVAPWEALSVAEEAGVMVELGRWTVDRASRDLELLRRHLPDLWMSINFSANQIDQSLPAVVENALVAAALPPQALVLEITEATATQISEGVLEAVAELGVSIALDDFGTGYSSFARLDRLPIDVLKIDRSFLARTPALAPSPLFRAIVELGNSLGLQLVAEGVETEEHRRMALDAGCQVAQGWLYSAALPVEELIAYLGQVPSGELAAAH